MIIVIEPSPWEFHDPFKKNRNTGWTLDLCCALDRRMSGSSELNSFEAYCELLYTSPNADERAKAETALLQLSTTAEHIPQCQFVLNNSKMS